MTPSTMQAVDRWLVWQLSGDKKLPHDWRDPLGKPIDSTSEEHWTSHANALQVAETHGLGLGFALGDEWAGVDLDDVRDPATGQLTAEAQAIVAQLDSYSEISPSGTGVKIFLNASVGKNHKRAGLEVYGYSRYFTVTGQHLEGTPAEPQRRGEKLAALIDREFPAAAAKTRGSRKAPTPTLRIVQGGRDNTLTSLGGKLRRQGFEEPAIRAALLAHNETHSQPPLPRHDVERIARSVCRYTPAADVFPLTETGDAEYFASCFGNHVRFDHRRGRFLLFDEHRWAPDLDGELQRLALTSIRFRQEAALQAEDLEERKRRVSWSMQGESRRRIENALHLAKKIQPISDAGDSWDRDPWLLGVRNGIVDLHTGTLRVGSPEDRVTMCAATAFDPEALCPLWEQTVAEIFNHDEQLISYIQRAFGYSLTGDCREECLFLLWGDGRNGKGTLVNTLAWLLGDYADNLSFSALELHERGSSTSTNDVAKLVAKRYVTASESGESARFNESRIKALTGRDPITARFLYQEEFTFTPEAKFWLSSNRKPRVRDNSEGFWSRIHLIPFTQSFAGREDMQLKDKLRAEGAGILAWAMRGCLTWQREGLKPPTIVREATQEYRRENEPLASFFEACCVIREGVRVQAGELYAKYLAWCDATHVKEWQRLKLKPFGMEIKKRFSADEGRHVFYLGIGIRHSERSYSQGLI